MGERGFFQPLTAADRISVLIYRAGIAVSCLSITAGTLFFLGGDYAFGVTTVAGRVFWGGIALDMLVAGAGLSSVFIHLYVSQFHRALKRLYAVALAGWAGLLISGSGNPVGPLVESPALALFLLPLAGCLAFIAAKEAFCFQLFEGYLLGILLCAAPAIIALGEGGVVIARWWAVLLALNFIVFSGRKVFMPLAFDIGDKSAYR